MVEYEVKRIQDDEGGVSVFVHVPSVNKILPITFNRQTFEKMSEDEIEFAVAEMIDQMFSPPPQTGVVVTKAEVMRKRFGLQDGGNQVRESRIIMAKPSNVIISTDKPIEVHK
jgi:hypothetical protein